MPISQYFEEHGEEEFREMESLVLDRVSVVGETFIIIFFKSVFFVFLKPARRKFKFLSEFSVMLPFFHG